MERPASQNPQRLTHESTRHGRATRSDQPASLFDELFVDQWGEKLRRLIGDNVIPRKIRVPISKPAGKIAEVERQVDYQGLLPSQDCQQQQKASQNHVDFSGMRSRGYRR